ncbi:MAG: nicotinate (nicotinamide) nucleotide adenylyltransferase [Patescibacteria group bacterium]
MKKIEIMGASFDPPHRGHGQIVSGLLDQLVPDEIWLVPARQHAFSKTLTDPIHRLAMLELLLQDFVGKPVEINRYELDKEGVSYSYDTLVHFAEAQPLDTFAWVIGSDNLANFPRWYNYLKMLERFSVHVYPRPENPMHPLLPGMIPLNGVDEVAVSSSDVRKTILAGKDPTELVGEKVARYIRDNNLYKGEVK